MFHRNQPNVGKYITHGWYGIGFLDVFRAKCSEVVGIMESGCRISMDIRCSLLVQYILQKIAKLVQM